MRSRSPSYLVMSRQLGMRFSRFEADNASGNRNKIDMRIDGARFSQWVANCFDRLDGAQG